jgi:hypothetical protein
VLEKQDLAAAARVIPIVDRLPFPWSRRGGGGPRQYCVNFTLHVWIEASMD